MEISIGYASHRIQEQAPGSEEALDGLVRVTVVGRRQPRGPRFPVPEQLLECERCEAVGFGVLTENVERASVTGQRGGSELCSIQSEQRCEKRSLCFRQTCPEVFAVRARIFRNVTYTG